MKCMASMFNASASLCRCFGSIGFALAGGGRQWHVTHRKRSQLLGDFTPLYIGAEWDPHLWIRVGCQRQRADDFCVRHKGVPTYLVLAEKVLHAQQQRRFVAGAYTGWRAAVGAEHLHAATFFDGATRLGAADPDDARDLMGAYLRALAASPAGIGRFGTSAAATGRAAIQASTSDSRQATA